MTRRLQIIIVNQRRILVVSASAGTGHIRAAMPIDQLAVRAELGLRLGAPIALIVGGGFLVEAGAALPASTPETMQAAMRTLFDSDARLELGRAALSLGRPQAAEAVTQQVIHELEREVAA